MISSSSDSCFSALGADSDDASDYISDSSDQEGDRVRLRGRRFYIGQRNFIKDSLMGLVYAVRGLAQSALSAFIGDNAISVSVIEDEMSVLEAVLVFKNCLDGAFLSRGSVALEMESKPSNLRILGGLSPHAIMKSFITVSVFALSSAAQRAAIREIIHHLIAEALLNKNAADPEFATELMDRKHGFWEWCELWRILPDEEVSDEPLAFFSWPPVRDFLGHAEGAPYAVSCRAFSLVKRLVDCSLHAVLSPEFGSLRQCSGDSDICRLAAMLKGPLDGEAKEHQQALADLALRSVMALDRGHFYDQRPYVSHERPSQEALGLLLDLGLDKVNVWSARDACPIATFGPEDFLMSVVAHLRGDGLEGLQMRCREGLMLGTWGSDVVSIDHEAPLLHALILMIETGWSSLPLVENSGRFRGVVTTQFVTQFLASLIEDLPQNQSHEALYENDLFTSIRELYSQNSIETVQFNREKKDSTRNATNGNMKPGDVVLTRGTMGNKVLRISESHIESYEKPFPVDVEWFTRPSLLSKIASGPHEYFGEFDPLTLPIKRFIPFFSNLNFVEPIGELQPVQARPIVFDTPEGSESKVSAASIMHEIEELKRSVLVPSAIRGSDLTVREAVIVLCFAEAGRIFMVNDDDCLLGVITQKDILRALLGCAMPFMEEEDTPSLYLNDELLRNQGEKRNGALKGKIRTYPGTKDIIVAQGAACVSCANSLCRSLRWGKPMSGLAREECSPVLPAREWVLGGRLPSKIATGDSSSICLYGTLQAGLDKGGEVRGRHYFPAERQALIEELPEVSCVKLPLYN